MFHGSAACVYKFCILCTLRNNVTMFLLVLGFSNCMLPKTSKRLTDVQVSLSALVHAFDCVIFQTMWSQMSVLVQHALGIAWQENLDCMMSHERSEIWHDDLQLLELFSCTNGIRSQNFRMCIAVSNQVIELWLPMCSGHQRLGFVSFTQLRWRKALCTHTAYFYIENDQWPIVSSSFLNWSLLRGKSEV